MRRAIRHSRRKKGEASGHAAIRRDRALPARAVARAFETERGRAAPTTAFRPGHDGRASTPANSGSARRRPAPSSARRGARAGAGAMRSRASATRRFCPADSARAGKSIACSTGRRAPAPRRAARGDSDGSPPSAPAQKARFSPAVSAPLQRVRVAQVVGLLADTVRSGSPPSRAKPPACTGRNAAAARAERLRLAGRRCRLATISAEPCVRLERKARETRRRPPRSIARVPRAKAHRIHPEKKRADRAPATTIVCVARLRGNLSISRTIPRPPLSEPPHGQPRQFQMPQDR